jgi:hypothetical protein
VAQPWLETLMTQLSVLSGLVQVQFLVVDSRVFLYFSARRIQPVSATLHYIQACLLWEVVPQQFISVLVCPTLPRTARVTEIDFHTCAHRERFTGTTLTSPIPGQSLAQMLRQLVHLCC